MYCIGVERVIR